MHLQIRVERSEIVIRTRVRGLVGAMIPSRLCCRGSAGRPDAGAEDPVR